MKKEFIFRVFFIISLVVVFFGIANFAYAQDPACSGANPPPGCSGPNPPSGTQTGTTTIKLPNPIGVDDLLEFVKTIFDIVWKIGIPVIAVFIIYAGFSFVRARGNSTELEKAKKMFVGVLIGAAIVLGAWVLASALGATVKKLQDSQAGIIIKKYL